MSGPGSGNPAEGRETEAVAEVAARHGFSVGAVAALWDAMRRGGGRMAQFSHPELGGMGQWSGGRSGGMLQIGVLFDHGLKARVAAACADLAGRASSAGTELVRNEPVRSEPDRGEPAGEGQWQGQWQSQGRGLAGLSAALPEAGSRGEPQADWWPGGLGRPSASGSQAGAQGTTRYAYFAEERRLAVERAGRVTLYDTGRHRIFGVSQSMSRGERLAFTADDGTVDLESLAIVGR